MTTTTAPWAAPDHAAHLAAQLVAMPVSEILTVWMRDSWDRQWAVRRLAATQWQAQRGGTLFIGGLSAAVELMEDCSNA